MYVALMLCNGLLMSTNFSWNVDHFIIFLHLINKKIVTQIILSPFLLKATAYVTLKASEWNELDYNKLLYVPFNMCLNLVNIANMFMIFKLMAAV